MTNTLAFCITKWQNKLARLSLEALRTSVMFETVISDKSILQICEQAEKDCQGQTLAYISAEIITSALLQGRLLTLTSHIVSDE
jgi:hypothetical protein